MADKAVLENLRAQIAALESGCGQDSCVEDQTAYEEMPVFDNQPNRAHKPDMPGEHASDALKKIVALVNASDKSERAIRERLARSGFEEIDIEKAVDDAKRYGFIDDARFSEVLIRSRISQCKGSAGIVRELAENGIDASDVIGWPFEFPVSYEEEVDRALNLLERKPPRSKNKREGAYRRLMQKGYPSAVASSAARIWTEQ